MNKEDIISFEDILKHPHHYISKLVSDDKNSFLLYQYGPYLAVNYPEIISKYKRIEYKNEIFLLMTDIAMIFNISEKRLEIKLAKKILIDLIQICNTQNYQFSDKVCNIAAGVLAEIRNYQMASKSLESAILNYSPITGYMNKLSSPELMSKNETVRDNNFEKLIYDLHGIDISDNVLIEKIKKIFIEDPLVIIKYNEVFLNIDYVITLDSEKQNTNIPSDIIPFLAIRRDNVRLYYILVYLAFVVDKSSRFNIITKIENISSVYNKTHSGSVIDIRKALESFSFIAFSENNLPNI